MDETKPTGHTVTYRAAEGSVVAIPFLTEDRAAEIAELTDGQISE